jgi:hypothetical protein
MKNHCIVPVWLIVLTGVVTLLGPKDVVEDNGGWWPGNRIFGTGTRGGTCDVDEEDDIQVIVLELLLFVFDE